MARNSQPLAGAKTEAAGHGHSYNGKWVEGDPRLLDLVFNPDLNRVKLDFKQAMADIVGHYEDNKGDKGNGTY